MAVVVAGAWVMGMVWRCYAAGCAVEFTLAGLARFPLLAALQLRLQCAHFWHVVGLHMHRYCNASRFPVALPFLGLPLCGGLGCAHAAVP